MFDFCFTYKVIFTFSIYCDLVLVLLVLLLLLLLLLLLALQILVIAQQRVV